MQSVVSMLLLLPTMSGNRFEKQKVVVCVFLLSCSCADSMKHVFQKPGVSRSRFVI